MAISLDKLIRVAGGVTNTGFNATFLNGIMLTKNTLIPNNGVNNVIPFTNADAVGRYFGLSSAEYERAVNYFKNYNNALSIPNLLYFGLYIDTNLAPYTRGAILTSSDLETLQAITAGSMTFKFDNVNTTISGIDLSATSSFSGIAVILQAAMVTAGITLAEVTYSSITESFTFSNGDLSGTGTVGYIVDSALATALKATQDTGAVLSQGSIALSVAENLDSYTVITTNYCNIETVFDLSGSANYATVAAFSKWVGDKNYRYAFFFWTDESNMEIPGNTSNIAYALVAAGRATLNTDGSVTYHDPIYPIFSLGDLPAMQMGAAASVNYNTPNSTISFAYKNQDGIVPLVTTDDAFDALELLGFNFLGKFNSRANTYNFTFSGTMGGQYLWLDFLMNQIWLSSTIQDSIATLMGSVGKLNNNRDGYTTLRTVIGEVAQQGISNGTITIGSTFSAATIAALKQQADGVDISSALTANGWYLQIIPPTPADRVLRKSPKITLWYTNAGSILKLDIATDLVF